VKKKPARTEATTVGAIDDEALRYTAGRDVELDLALVEADCIGSAAHAVMLSRLRLNPPLFTPAQLRRVLRELAAIRRAAARGEFTIRPADQDAHLAVERTLTERLGELGRRIHAARSRNDQVAVDLRLFAKRELLGALAETAALAATLLEFGERHAGVPLVGRTHMQPAMPSSVGLWATAGCESLLDDASVLLQAYELNDQCPLGSAASYGVPLPIDRQLVSDLLGFSRPIHNVLHANNTRGKNEGFILFALGQTMVTLSRLAQDMILFSMPEFAYFRLPAAFCTGSSIMPQKRNPDVLELVRARAARLLADAHVLQEILRAAPTGYNRDLQETKEPFLNGLASARATLRVMDRLVAGTRVDEAACRRAFTPDVFATDRALELVVGGTPFRDAYHHVKAHLGELRARDPVEALMRKTHLGAPAGLDYAAYRERINALRETARAETAEFDAAIRRLLGR